LQPSQGWQLRIVGGRMEMRFSVWRNPWQEV
jgi:hypothetical protein